jgi:hypothetical protein
MQTEAMTNIEKVRILHNKLRDDWAMKIFNTMSLMHMYIISMKNKQEFCNKQLKAVPSSQKLIYII